MPGHKHALPSCQGGGGRSDRGILLRPRRTTDGKRSGATVSAADLLDPSRAMAPPTLRTPWRTACDHRLPFGGHRRAGSLVGPVRSSLGSKAHRRKDRTPSQTVCADFPHTTYRWSLGAMHYAASARGDRMIPTATRSPPRKRKKLTGFYPGPRIRMTLRAPHVSHTRYRSTIVGSALKTSSRTRRKPSSCSGQRTALDGSAARIFPASSHLRAAGVVIGKRRSMRAGQTRTLRSFPRRPGRQRHRPPPDLWRVDTSRGGGSA